MHRPKWQLALDMVEEAIGWGLRPPLICGDAGYGEITAFRSGLDEREIPYIVQVKHSTSAYPESAAPAAPRVVRPRPAAGRALSHQALVAARPDPRRRP